MVGYGDALRMPPVLVAMRHATTRAGVRAVLQANGFRVCAEADSPAAAVAAAGREQPQLCLLEADLLGPGLGTLREILTHALDCAVVVIGVHPDDDLLLDALLAGAAGVLLKETRTSRLPYALHRVLAGEILLPREMVTLLVSRMRSGPRRQLPVSGGGLVSLTGREFEVAERLRRGWPTARIAVDLGVSDTTVRSHVARLMKKLRVSGRGDVVQLLGGDDGTESVPPASA